MKLGFSETSTLRAGFLDDISTHTDYSVVDFDGVKLVSSIDKIFSVERPWPEFARLALLHGGADVLCGRAVPSGLTVCYEFGPGLDVGDRYALSRAVATAAAELGLVLGKCHSTFAGTTALTVNTVGAQFAREPIIAQSGALLLTRPLGGLPELYLSALGAANSADVALQQMTRSHVPLVVAAERSIDYMTDVSGFGLAGALRDAASATGRALNVRIDAGMFITDPALRPDLSCLQAEIADFYEHTSGPKPLREALLMREMCGPLLVMCRGDEVDRFASTANGHGFTQVLRIGSFDSGSGGVRVTCQ